MRLVRQVLLLCLVGMGMASAASAPTESPQPALSADEALIVHMINAERTERGMTPLALDPLLIEVARAHSLDMAERGYFSHLAPDPLPSTPLDRYLSALEIASERSPLIGENIGRAGEPVMAVIHERMMASAEHRANILDREYARTGVGIYALPDGRVWLTEMFGGELP